MEKAKLLISTIAMRESPEELINGLSNEEVKEMLEYFRSYEDQSRVSKFIKLLEKKDNPKHDKLPRLNFLTMSSAMIQYARDGKEEDEELALEHLDCIWRNLSKEDREWLLEHENYDATSSYDDILLALNKEIELVYSE